MAIVCLLIPFMVQIVYSLKATKQAYLTPINLSSNGVSTTLLRSIDFTNNPRPKWLLHNTGKNATGFQLQLSLDESWAFSSTQNTTLTLEIEASPNTDAPWPNYHDLLVVFTQDPYNSFFATRITMIYRSHNNPPDHAIYPATDWDDGNGGKSYLRAGSAESLVEIDYYSRLTSLTNGVNDNQWYSPVIYNGYPWATSPLTLKLENSPQTQELIYTYWSAHDGESRARTCRYYDIDGDKAMKIFFAGDGIYDSVDIESIRVILEYSITESPTKPPTATTYNPTTDPTSNPSQVPSRAPTVDPTSVPSKSPTNQPSISPSLNPSISPTVSTNTPTFVPTFDPTMDPTKPQGGVKEDLTTTNDAYTDGPKQSGSRNLDNITMYIVIGSVVSIVILVVFILFIKKLCSTYTDKLSNINLKPVPVPQSPSSVGHHAMTQMVIQEAHGDSRGVEIETRVDDEEKIYDEVGSVDSVGILTPNFHALATHTIGIQMENLNIMEGGNDAETEEMYGAGNDNETSGNVTVTKGREASELYCPPSIFEDPESEKIYDSVEDVVTATSGMDNVTTKGDEDEVGLWLTNEVELPQYYNLFVENGLDSLKLIRKLDNKALVDLGATLEEHRIILMRFD